MDSGLTEEKRLEEVAKAKQVLEKDKQYRLEQFAIELEELQKKWGIELMQGNIYLKANHV